MKKIELEILRQEDERLVMDLLNALQENGKIALRPQGGEAPAPAPVDSNDEELMDLLDRADREKGIPYEELRKRFGL